jgi:L-lactate dehydrogenase complex protein LldG
MVYKEQEMNSRSTILNAVSINKPALVPLPDLPTTPIDCEPFVKLQKFVTVHEGIGGKVIQGNDLSPVLSMLEALNAAGKVTASLCADLPAGNFLVQEQQSATELEEVDTAFIDASWGVAENGAVWISESQFKNRLLPFICQHLVIVLKSEKILSDMHEAYRCIQIDCEGYGLFLAGPSKTADIEQSLVIGAHGARSCTVYLLHKQ